MPSTIAQSIGLQDARDRPLMEHLVSQLRERQVLIVLDNFEHLLAGAPVVTRLLQETSAVRILVSSRSSLRVSGEQECPVPPLAVPEQDARPTAASLAACESVRLFAERAAAAVPGFTLDDENAPAIAHDRPQAGRPAAGHRAGGGAGQAAAAGGDPAPAGTLAGPADRRRPRPAGPPADVARDDRVELRPAERGGQAAPRRVLGVRRWRQPGDDRGGLRRRRGYRPPVLDGLQELVDHSLLRQVRSPGLPPGRYAMLETIREYAAERLDHMPEADRARGAHAAAFLAQVEADGRPHAGMAKKEWLERVDTEHNNIRAALGWYRAHDPPAALRLAASMSAFWSLRGHHTEGRQRLGELLGMVPDPIMARASALNGAAWLAIDQGDYAHAAGLLEESIGLSRALGDPVGEGIATVYLGRCKLSSLRIAEAVPYVERAVALVNEAGTARRSRSQCSTPLWSRSSPASRKQPATCSRRSRRDGHRTRPGAAERARPLDARLPAAGPGRAVRGQGSAGGGLPGFPRTSATAGSPRSAWAASPGSRPRPGAPAWPSGWPGPPRRTGTRTSSPCPRRSGRSSTAGSRLRAPRPGGQPGGCSRRAGGEPGGGSGARPGERAG